MSFSRETAGIAAELCALVEDLLETGPVAPQDDLIALGADSLTLTALGGRIADRWGVTLAFAELMREPVLSQVAARVASRLDGDQASSASGRDHWDDLLLDLPAR